MTVERYESVLGFEVAVGDTVEVEALERKEHLCSRIAGVSSIRVALSRHSDDAHLRTGMLMAYHTMLMTLKAHLRTHISRGLFADLSLHPPRQVAATGVCHDEVERVGRLK